MASIFVSSTFKDMQAERDLIRDRVLPAVQEFAFSRGGHVDMVDLRWGIDTGDLSEEESGIKVLRTCFDEIDRSRPFFLALLGGRYGWIPGLDILSASLAGLSLVPRGTPQSVTELEITYGALAADMPRPEVFFYFREGIDRQAVPAEVRDRYFDQGENAERLQALKQEIRAAFPDRVRTYTPRWETDGFTDLEALGGQMTEDVIGALAQMLPDLTGASWQEDEERLQEQFSASRLRRFQGRAGLLSELAAGAASGGMRVMLIGESGTGKSALLCKAAQRFRSEGALVLPFFCGLSPRSSLAETVMLQGIWRLERHLSLAPESTDAHSFEEIRRRFFTLLSQALPTTRIVLVVDALNQLHPGPRTERLLWLAGMPAGVSVLCSITHGPEVAAFEALGGRFLPLPSLTGDETAAILDDLVRSHHKELDPRVRAAIRAKRDDGGEPAASNPLYLQLLVHELVMMDRYDHAEIDALCAAGMKAEDAIAAHMAGLVEESDGTPDGEYLAYLQRLAGFFGTKPFYTLLLALASSRHGLRESDLEALFQRAGMPWSASDFAWMRQLLREHLAQVGAGQWEFTHGLLRTALLRSANADKMEWINGLLSLSLMDGADRFCARERMHHLWLARLPGVAAMIIAKSDGHWDREYADGLAQVWASRQSEWALLLARSDGADSVPDSNLAPASDSVSPGDHAVMFLLDVLRHVEDLTKSQRNRLTRFACQDLQNALPADFPPETRVKLLEAVLAAQRELGGKDGDGMAAEALCRLQLGIHLTGVGRREEAREHLEGAERHAVLLVRHDPAAHRLLLASIRSAMGDLLLSGLKDLKGVVAYEHALEPFSMGDSPLRPEEVAVRAAIHAKLSAARGRLGHDAASMAASAEESVADSMAAHSKMPDAASELRLAGSWLQRAESLAEPTQALEWVIKAQTLMQAAYQREASPEVLRMLVAVTLKRAFLEEQAGGVTEGLEAEGVRLARLLHAQTGQPGDRLFLANALYRQAERMLHEGLPAEAEPVMQACLEAALAVYERTGSPESGLQACDAAEYLALLLPALDRGHEARPHLEKRVAITEALYGECATGTEISGGDFPRIQRSYMAALADLGRFLVEDGTPLEAVGPLQMRAAFHEMFYEDSCADIDTGGNDGDEEAISRCLHHMTEYYEALKQLADAMDSAGEPKDAQEHYFRMAEIASEVFGRTHRAGVLLLYAQALCLIGGNETDCGEWDDALGHFAEMERAFRALVRDHPTEQVLAIHAVSMRAYGIRLVQAGRREEAERALGDAMNALSALREHAPDTYGEMAATTEVLIEALLKEGNTAHDQTK